MSLKRKLEGEIEISESFGDVLYDLYKSRPHHIPYSGGSKFIQKMEMNHGEFGTPGSILTCYFTLDGKQRSNKTLIEEIDEEKKMVTQKVIEGDLLDGYKSLVMTCQVLPKDEETSIVKWILKYNKEHPAIPEPSALLDNLLNGAKDMDDHHQFKAAKIK